MVPTKRGSQSPFIPWETLRRHGPECDRYLPDHMLGLVEELDYSQAACPKPFIDPSFTEVWYDDVIYESGTNAVVQHMFSAAAGGNEHAALFLAVGDDHAVVPSLLPNAE